MKHISKAVNTEIEDIKVNNSSHESISTSDRIKLATVILLVASLLVLIILKS